VHQYRPVSLKVAREIWKARPVNIALDSLMKNRRIRFDEVRSQGKLLVSMLRGWRMLQKPTSRNVQIFKLFENIGESDSAGP
jgi:hypothetical protein